MSGVEHMVVLINSGCAALAFFVNAATSRAAPPPWKLIRALVSCLALIYSIAYLWLFLHPDRLLAWSSTMRGVSLLSWPIVWVRPAVVTLRVIRLTRRVAELERSAE